MNRAGLNPSVAMIRGMSDTQARTVNSRWFRHSAAGVRLAAPARTLAWSGAASQEIAGGHRRKLRCRSGAAPSGALPSPWRWPVPRSVTGLFLLPVPEQQGT